MTFQQLLFRLVRFSGREYAIALVPQAFRLGMMFAPAFVVRAIFDQLSNNAPLGWNYWSLVALLVGVALARIVSLIVAVGLESMAALRTNGLMRVNLFERWLLRPDAANLPLTSGEAVNRMRVDPATIGLSLARAEQTFGSLVAGAVAFYAMVSVNWQLALVPLAPMIASVIVVNALSRLRLPAFRAERDAYSAISGFLGDVFGAVQAVQIAGAETQAVQHLRLLNQTRQHALLKERVLDALVMTFGFIEVGTALVLLLAVQSMRVGTFTVGDFALFTFAVPIVMDTSFLIGALLSTMKSARVAFERLTDGVSLSGAPALALVQPQPIAMGIARKPLATPSAGAHVHADALRAMAVHGLAYHYPGTSKGIEVSDLRIQRGQIVVITGRIGSGKTTLLRVLLGLLPKDAGEVLWNGQCVDDLATFMMPPRCAYTPQAPRLFSETLRENILMGLLPSPPESQAKDGREGGGKWPSEEQREGTRY